MLILELIGFYLFQQSKEVTYVNSFGVGNIPKVIGKFTGNQHVISANIFRI